MKIRLSRFIYCVLFVIIGFYSCQKTMEVGFMKEKEKETIEKEEFLHSIIVEDDSDPEDRIIREDYDHRSSPFFLYPSSPGYCWDESSPIISRWNPTKFGSKLNRNESSIWLASFLGNSSRSYERSRIVNVFSKEPMQLTNNDMQQALWEIKYQGDIIESIRIISSLKEIEKTYAKRRERRGYNQRRVMLTKEFIKRIFVKDRFGYAGDMGEDYKNYLNSLCHFSENNLKQENAKISMQFLPMCDKEYLESRGEIFNERKVKIYGQKTDERESEFMEFSKLKYEDYIQGYAADLVGNTRYRGEFEEKVNKIFQAIVKYRLIVFIDEIHTVIKLGGADGGIDINNILKSIIHSPNLQLIGATTEEEFELFQKDKAFKRRFNILKVKEFSQNEVSLIFKQILDNVLVLYVGFIENPVILTEYLLKRKDTILNYLEEFQHTCYACKLVDFFDYCAALYIQSKKISDFQQRL